MLVSLGRTLLTELLAFESGIDVRLHDWYLDQFRTPSIEAPAVRRPGRCVRHVETGALLWKKVSVEEYFAGLGVLPYFEPGRPDSLRVMQYRSMNALGFFGFQLGESALQDLGLYQPRVVKAANGEQALERLYCGEVPVTSWANGCEETLFWWPSQSKWILATDVNRWDGTFSGRHGITSFDDCFDEGKQRVLVTELMRKNASAILERFAVVSVNWREVFNSRNVDWSGVLAAAHLRGPVAVAEYLVAGVESADEYGTNLRRYFDRFGELDISEIGLSEPV